MALNFFSEAQFASCLWGKWLPWHKGPSPARTGRNYLRWETESLEEMIRLCTIRNYDVDAGQQGPPPP